ncbi:MULTISPECIES: acetyl-CoA carboxylase biotin carboxylase subunit family protein [unclassified Photorhabdus]|uniref:ATP-grasp domain-containing protein n=1 Tax=unclassified Photorhabdus TaxID=2620880 RepID=UPI000DCBC527|nr:MULTISPECIES: serine kinase [unclassified Photorhabdus]RAW97447.1 serine kinase [Photorhabdus sp. S9-53]RAX00082.1 serine kinase [Photorhabdus sp. S10-54]RAX04415.1 serine kinase [Photorhabdus sp. S8-52]
MQDVKLNTILIVSCEPDITEKTTELAEQFVLSDIRFIFLIEDFTQTTPNYRSEEHYIVRDFSVHSDVMDAIDKIIIRHKISAVISSDEFSVFVAASAREKMKIPGMTCTQARRFRDKKMMKQVAEQGGISTPKEFTLDNIRDDSTIFPIVIKPRSLAGSVGVEIIATAECLVNLTHPWNDSYHDMDAGQFIIEKYNPQDIFHIDCIVLSGCINFISVSEYQGKPIDFLQGQPLGSFSVEESYIEKYWHPFTERVLSAFVAPDGVYHIEAFGNSGNVPELLEIAYRPGGAGIVDIIQKVYGLDLRLIHLAAQLGIINGINYQSRADAFAYLIFPKEHTAVETKFVTRLILPNLESLPTLIKYMIPSVGDVATGEFYCHKDCLGMFIFSGDREMVYQDFQCVINNYTVQTGFK